MDRYWSLINRDVPIFSTALQFGGHISDEPWHFSQNGPRSATFRFAVYKNCTEQVSADADGPRDAASRPVDRRAVHRAGGRRVRSTVGDRRRLLIALTTSAVAARSLFISHSPTAGQMLKVKSLGQSTTGMYHNFCIYLNFPKTQCSISRLKPVCKKTPWSVHPFPYNTGVWQTDRQTDRHVDTRWQHVRASISFSRIKTKLFISSHFLRRHTECIYLFVWLVCNR